MYVVTYMYIIQYVFYTGSSRKIAIYLNRIQYQSNQTFATAPVKEKWDLYSSVCLERHPIIIQSMQELELKLYNMLKQIELENSLKSDHELRREKEGSQQKMNIKDMDTISLQTAQDFEDSNQEELNNFKFAPIITSMYIIVFLM